MEKKGIIYKVTHSGSGKVYIGATTIGIGERKKDHIRKSKKRNFHLFQNAIATFGVEAFKWEQLDTANSINELAKKEKDYIFKYNSKAEGYNSDCGAGFQKSIYFYDLNGQLLNEFKSLEAAAKYFGLTPKGVSKRCLSLNNKIVGGYVSYEFREPFVPSTDKRKKRVVQLSQDGKLIASFDSIAVASRETGINKSSIAKASRGERKSGGGYLWKFF